MDPESPEPMIRVYVPVEDAKLARLTRGVGGERAHDRATDPARGHQVSRKGFRLRIFVDLSTFVYRIEPDGVFAKRFRQIRGAIW